MVSIADVAARAQVSPTTVSHTISGKRKVSQKVRVKVLAAMEDLGYVPSRSAQNLASGRTRLIGLIVPDIGNEYFAELTRGVEVAAVDRGYNVILCTTGFDLERERLYLSTLRSRAVDGLVYAAGAPPKGTELRKILGDLPTVLVDEQVPESSIPAVMSDNHAGGCLAARHLIALGHHHAVVLGAERDPVSSAERVRGFCETWREAAGSEPVVLSGSFTAQGGRDAVGSHLEALRADNITAIFAVNDLMALGAIEALEDVGVRFPEDMSIVGFDGISAGRFARPRLTTVRQDVGRLGARAVHRLISSLESEEELQTHVEILPVSLSVRDSTTTAPVARAESPVVAG